MQKSSDDIWLERQHQFPSILENRRFELSLALARPYAGGLVGLSGTLPEQRDRQGSKTSARTLAVVLDIQFAKAVVDFGGHFGDGGSGGMVTFEEEAVRGQFFVG